MIKIDKGAAGGGGVYHEARDEESEAVQEHVSADQDILAIPASEE